ncbi:MAG: MerR family transcriptional regulator [Eubacterium sp.]|nr:MerR family transcriptional regulator [Eubacterium sp.]
MKNLIRIGQVSSLYGISLDTLRYYDQKGLLKPIVDKTNGYRYYTFEHLDVLEMVLLGKYLEIPLEQIKEKIDTESIDGYLTMMQEQQRLIGEKLAMLTQLGKYTAEMGELLKNIQSHSNDYTFFNSVTKKEMNLEIYEVDIKNIFEKHNGSHTKGIEAFNQWVLYFVDEAGTILGNSQTIGLSLRNLDADECEIKAYLNRAAENGIITKYILSGKYRCICFWGNEDELQEYLRLLYSHFKLKIMKFFVRFRFALLHKNKKNEYYTEIFF